MDILTKLFGSPHRVKFFKLFYLNPDSVFTAKEVAKFLKVPLRVSSREIKLLLSIGFLKKGARIDEVKKGKRVSKKRISGIMLSRTFPLLLALRHLTITASPMSREKILRYLKNRSKIKLVTLGGVFTVDAVVAKESTAVAELVDLSPKLDLLIVGNGIKKSALERFIVKLGGEVGKELHWAFMSAPEFEQRMAMHDKFIRDLLDYPHEFLINKLGIE